MFFDFKNPVLTRSKTRRNTCMVLTGFGQKIGAVVARKAAQAAFDVGGHERWFRKRVVTVEDAY